MRDTYLSVDLDYWNKAAFEPALLDAVFDTGLPAVVALDHHDLLPHVASFPALTQLVNVDYHSDLMSSPEPLHIGNWVNHVPWRGGADYLWALPRLNDYHLKWGCCHVGENPFLDTVRLTGWRSADRREGYDLDELLPRVAAAGICVSPNYLDDGSHASAALRRLLLRMRDAGLSLIPSAKAANNARFLARLAVLGEPPPPLAARA